MAIWPQSKYFRCNYILHGLDCGSCRVAALFYEIPMT